MVTVGRLCFVASTCIQQPVRARYQRSLTHTGCLPTSPLLWQGVSSSMITLCTLCAGRRRPNSAHRARMAALVDAAARTYGVHTVRKKENSAVQTFFAMRARDRRSTRSLGPVSDKVYFVQRNDSSLPRTEHTPHADGGRPSTLDPSGRPAGPIPRRLKASPPRR